MQHDPANQPTTEMPLYWFAVLDRAVDEGQFEEAAEAQRQLARLGVRVSYGRSCTFNTDRELQPH